MRDAVGLIGWLPLAMRRRIVFCGILRARVLQMDASANARPKDQASINAKTAALATKREKTDLTAVQRHSIFPDAPFLLAERSRSQGADRLRRSERRHGLEHGGMAIAGELV